MTKFILHGGYTKADNEENRKFKKEIAKGLPKNFKLLLVFFSIEGNKHKDEFTSSRDDFSNQFPGKNPEVYLATKDKFIEQLKDADAVYLRGGDTKRLLDSLKVYGGLKEAMKDKVIFGSSAGAYVLSRYFHTEEDWGSGVFKGLGFVPVRVKCHYDKNKNKNAVDELNKYSKNLELVLLKDFEYKVYEI